MAMFGLSRFTSVAGCALFALSAACSGQNSLGDPTGATCPSTQTLTYDNFGKAFFDTNCNSCHGKTQGPSFATRQDILDNKTDIDRAAASGPKATNTYMPDDGDVSDADRKKLGEWLACGAP